MLSCIQKIKSAGENSGVDYCQLRLCPRTREHLCWRLNLSWIKGAPPPTTSHSLKYLIKAMDSLHRIVSHVPYADRAPQLPDAIPGPPDICGLHLSISASSPFKDGKGALGVRSSLPRIILPVGGRAGNISLYVFFGWHFQHTVMGLPSIADV